MSSSLVGPAPDLVAFSYLSTPTVPFSSQDTNDLLRAARAFNVRYEVSGKLIVLEDGERVVRFAQWIEGPPAAMLTCIGRILSDRRHSDFEVCHRSPIEGRRFAGWDMAFQPVDSVGFAAASSALAITG